MSTLNLTVEFTGGLELLFSNQQTHHITLSPPPSGPPTMKHLITWLVANLMADPRQELFVLDGGIRPGILVLINDADWELEGEEAYVLKEGDCVLLVSTLHGG